MVSSAGSTSGNCFGRRAQAVSPPGRHRRPRLRVRALAFPYLNIHPQLMTHPPIGPKSNTSAQLSSLESALQNRGPSFFAMKKATSTCTELLQVDASDEIYAICLRSPEC
jgi:hypothetical protein